MSNAQSPRRGRRPLSEQQRQIVRERRHESRASATYLKFLEDLRAAGFASDEQAERAARAVLCALEQRLSEDEGFKLNSQLPSKLRELLVPCERHELMLPREIGLPEFLDIVADHFVSGEIDSATVVRVVFETLARHVTPGEVHKVVHQLPAELRELWPSWALTGEAHPEPPPPRRRSEPAPEIVDELLGLPLGAQLGVLRTVIPRVLAPLNEEERETFFRDLRAELAIAASGRPAYDLRRSREPGDTASH